METIYRKVYTKDRLPHLEGTYFVKVKDSVLYHDIYFWHHHYDDVADEDQRDYWINTFEWWLEEVELPSEQEIQRWAYETEMEDNGVDFVLGVKETIKYITGKV
jgi:hypothetical protein